MQYILTEEEYQALIGAGLKVVEQQKAMILDLCMKVADHMPVRVRWREEDVPWKCIHSVDNMEWYCDECPVKRQCPYEDKLWSK